MHILESIRIALRSLWANKLRSVLTLLGVVIGVAAVIAVVTFVSGINDYVAKKIFNLGADVFIVSKMSAVETNVDHFLEAEKRKDIVLDDYEAVQQACHHCELVGAMMRGTGKVKRNEQSISDTTIQGITTSPTGLTIASAAVVLGNQAVLFWASSGQPGVTYKVMVSIITVGGRDYTRELMIPVSRDV